MRQAKSGTGGALLWELFSSLHLRPRRKHSTADCPQPSLSTHCADWAHILGDLHHTLVTRISTPICLGITIVWHCNPSLSIASLATTGHRCNSNNVSRPILHAALYTRSRPSPVQSECAINHPRRPSPRPVILSFFDTCRSTSSHEQLVWPVAAYFRQAQ